MPASLALIRSDSQLPDNERRFYSPERQLQRLGDAGNPQIRRWLEMIRPVALDTDMLRVLDVFREYQQEHFFPVLDDEGRPRGLVCERSLKNYVYSRYGMALLANRGQPKLLEHFISECPQVDVEVPLEQVLAAAHSRPNGEGVMVVWQGRYLGFVRASALVELAHELQMQTVHQHNLELDRKNRDIQAVLQNMRQGICTLLPDLTLHADYSAHLVELLGRDQLAGLSLHELLLQHAGLGADRLQQIETALGAILGQDLLMYECNAHLLPAELQASLGGQQKRLELHWRPLLDADERVERLMLVLRDVTRLTQLQEQSSRQQRELQLLNEILLCGQARFSEFMQQAREGLQGLLEQLDGQPGWQPDAAYRLLHTLKGNARTLGLLALTDNLHAAEELLQQPAQAGKAEPPPLMREALTDCQQDLQAYQQLFDQRLCGFAASQSSDAIQLDRGLWQQLQQLARRQPDGRLQQLLARQSLRPLHELLESQLQGLDTICRELHKPRPKVRINGNLYGTALQPPVARSLADCLTHILRNCMDHGIESPSQRLQAGKPEQGELHIEVAYVADGICLRLQDDGRGLGLAELRQRAEQRGELLPQQACSDEQLAELVFRRGLSTATQVSMLSGRGVGMDAVRSALQSVGGDVRLYWQQSSDVGQPRRAFGLGIRLPVVE